MTENPYDPPAGVDYDERRDPVFWVQVAGAVAFGLVVGVPVVLLLGVVVGGVLVVAALLAPFAYAVAFLLRMRCRDDPEFKGFSIFGLLLGLFFGFAMYDAYLDLTDPRGGPIERTYRSIRRVFREVWTPPTP